MKQPNLNKEEQALRQKIEGVEFDYQANEWAALEKQLPKQNITSLKKWSLASILSAIIAISGYFVLSQDKVQPIESINVNNKVQLQKEDIKEERTEVKSDIAKKLPSKNAEGKTQTHKNTKEVSVDLAETKHESENKVSNLRYTETTEAVSKREDSFQKQNDQSINQKGENIHNFKEGFIFEGKLCNNSTISVLPIDPNILSKAKRFEWYVNNEIASRKSSIELELGAEKSYDLTLKIWLIDSPEFLVSFDTNFMVSNLENIDFLYSENSGLFNDFEVEFTATPSEQDFTYKWTIEEKNTNSEANHTHTFPTKGIYTVSLEVSDKNGCTSAIEKPVAVKSDFGPFINAFTPDHKGPDLNNTFMPNGFSDFNGNFEFIVYDLQNRIVYQTKSIHEPWNGRLNNSGIALPAANYVWKVQVSDNKGNHRTFVDKVEIIRY